MATAHPSDATLYLPQACRGVACVMVAVFHGTMLVERWYGIRPLSVLYNFGFAGVHLFFVISGLIIYHAHCRDTDNYKNIPSYWIKRIIRIYPLYWIVFMTWGGWKVFANRLTVADFFGNALFFTATQHLIVQVSWTLVFEMMFYIVFTVFIASRRFGFMVFAAWFSLVFCNHFIRFTSFSAFNLANMLFVFGLGASITLASLKNKLAEEYHDALGFASLVAGLAVFGGTVVYCQLSGGMDFAEALDSMAATLGFGLGSGLVLLSSLSRKIEGFVQRQALMQLIGNASYSIYLTHFFMQRIVFNETRLIAPIWSPPKSEALADVLLAIVMTLSVFVGVIIHKWVEKPILTGLRKSLKIRKPKLAQA